MRQIKFYMFNWLNNIQVIMLYYAFKVHGKWIMSLQVKVKINIYNLFTDNLNWQLYTDKLLRWDKLWLTVSEVIQDNSRWLFRQDWLYFANFHVVENYVIERIKSCLATALCRIKTILLIEWHEFQKLKIADIKQKILFIFTIWFFWG